MEIVHLKKADTESIYFALVECLKGSKLKLAELLEWVLMEQVHSLERKSGVQTRIKKIAPHALFVHCHCHLLQLTCVQAANSTNGIKQVYVLSKESRIF